MKLRSQAAAQNQRQVVKLSLSLPAELVEEMKQEGQRLSRSLSWLAQQSWRISRGRLLAFYVPPSLHPYSPNDRPLGRRGPRRRR